jgi:transposase InsO family protein
MLFRRRRNSGRNPRPDDSPASRIARLGDPVSGLRRQDQAFGAVGPREVFRGLHQGLARSGPAEVESLLIDWIETWYNQMRRHRFIGCCSPAEYEARSAA